MKTPIALIASLFFGTLAAQELPLGGEFQVNTYTTGIQFINDVAANDDGSFVVVWHGPDDGPEYGIFAQRFSRVGTKLGTEFRVSTFTTGRQELARVAARGDGSFVVVWPNQFPQDGSGYGVFGQRFGLLPGPIPKFGKLGDEFPVNTYTLGDQLFPAVAMDHDGRFAVVWESDDQDGSGSGVFGQLFDAAGNRVGAEFPVASNTLGGQVAPAVGFDGSGNFVVVWQSLDFDYQGIFGQRFDASGAKIGLEFPVNEAVTGSQQEPAISVGESGEFVVVWTSYGDPGFQGDIFARRFDIEGNPVGTEFRVNSYTTGTQQQTKVATDRVGNFLVVWDSGDQGGSGFNEFGQLFDRTGARIGGEFALSTYTTLGGARPSVAAGGNGFVIVWSSLDQDGSDFGVFARREDRVGQGLVVDSRNANGTSSDANGVFEPGETVLVGPAWSNESPGDFGDFAGTAASFTGPINNGPTYGLTDASADYGALSSGAFGDCDDATPDACYRLSVLGPRPAPHWDGTLVENVTGGGGHAWKLHIGDSFSDVPRSEPFYKKIETMLHHGITLGCGPTTYCPGQAIPRDQMAIFVAKGIAGSGDLIPTTGTLSGQPYDCSPGGVSRFSDVAPTDTACKHIHFIAVENVTLGCGAGTYCPTQSITRDAMASFIAKATVAPGGGAAVPQTFSDSTTGRSYSCDPSSPNIHFTDVPVSQPFCKHIHFLWSRGIVDGCSATTYCPSGSVQRDAMAKFIANGFGLQLYGP